MRSSLQTGRTQFILVLLALTPAAAVAQNSALGFDHPSGFYDSPFQFAISTTAKDATIYFTTNGTAPTPTSGFRHSNAIPVSSTTVIRATAFRENTAVTEVATRTYLFTPAITQQTGDQLPKIWGTHDGQPVPAHYRMDANSHETQSELVGALRAIPSLSIVTDPEHLFSAASGIYLHPSARGGDWERPASVELFDPNGADGFQVDCGIRIHGGMSRNPEESPKHSFRLLFKRRYGPAKLQCPLFGPDDPREFDELVLRAGSNDSWLDSNGDQRRQAAYLRDEWMRRSLRDLGHPSARGRFMHLYLNGLYWGVYNLCERPGGPLLAARPGTRAASYDVRKGNETESGDSVVWNKLLALANSSSSDEQNYRALRQHLDLPQLVDYLLLNFYAGNSDWDRSANWYAIRPRTADGKFQFFVWDGERTLEDVRANTIDLDDDESPLRLFQKLSEHAAFRTLFAERAQGLLFGDGALSPHVAAARFQSLADSIAKALPAESARWGSYRRDVHPFKTGPYECCTMNEHWQPEVDRIVSQFFPARRDVLLKQLQERGLFPVQQ